MGFIRSSNEPTVYTKKIGNIDVLLLCLYVDDILYMEFSKEMIMEFKETMMKTFEMSDLGPMRYFLGLEVAQKRGSVFVPQQKYASDLLYRAGMTNYNSVSTPLNSNEKLKLHDNSGDTNPLRYINLVGELLYLTHTRPYIMYAVSVISCFMQSPSVNHLGAAK